MPINTSQCGKLTKEQKFDFEHEGELLIIYAKKDNQATYYLLSSNPAANKTLFRKELYGLLS